jgi:carbonic anhydrase
VEANVVLQMDHLQTYPTIAHKLDNGDLTVSGWILFEDEGFVAQYDAEKKVFLLLTQKLPPRVFTRTN